jgi:hypothetical protein
VPLSLNQPADVVAEFIIQVSNLAARLRTILPPIEICWVASWARTFEHDVFADSWCLKGG